MVAIDVALLLCSANLLRVCGMCSVYSFSWRVAYRVSQLRAVSSHGVPESVLHWVSCLRDESWWHVLANELCLAEVVLPLT